VWVMRVEHRPVGSMASGISIKMSFEAERSLEDCFSIFSR
jgi:hypothetical protein